MKLRSLLVSAALAVVGSGLGAVSFGQTPEAPSAAEARPNVVFIGAEDVSPRFGCYGDRAARTPNLDRLASEGARFDRAFTHCPVCAPSRSGMVTGMYPISFGTHHMRSRLAKAPPRLFTEDLLTAGYHVRWPGKTDFNFPPPAHAFSSRERWDDEATLKSLPQPFFAYINFNATHEARLHGTDFEKVTRDVLPRTNPASVPVPAYLPDVPEVRRSIAEHYDTIAALDADLGRVLSLIDRAGLRENTVVVFWGDHGSGLPRGKRWCYDSGIRCPLIVRWPGKIKPGSVRSDLIATVDLAPTFIQIAGVRPPDRLHGRPMFDQDGAAPREPARYVFAARDRMDETHDRIRSARGERFHYLRNYHPERPYAQPIKYVELHPVMKAWRSLHERALLRGAPALFFAPRKPAEELYDTFTDPDEVVNLIDSPNHAHRAAATELRAAMDGWLGRIGDLGVLNESELVADGILIETRNPTSGPAGTQRPD